MIFSSQAQVIPTIRTPEPEIGLINASETLLLNSSIDSTAYQAAFILRWENASSELEMVLISPSGLLINQSAEPPVFYKSKERTESYMVDNPEAGNWVARIAAKNVPAQGEIYNFLTINVIGEELIPDNETEQDNATDLNSSDEMTAPSE